MKRIMTLALAALCLWIVPTSAKAACGNFGATGLKNSIKLPILAQAELGFPNPIVGANSSIVGLWHVIYTNGTDGSTFNDTFDTWHGDGTEFESAFLAPAGGDVCVGVWKQTGLRSVSLHHVGWLFDPSTPTATATNTFTLDERRQGFCRRHVLQRIIHVQDLEPGWDPDSGGSDGLDCRGAHHTELIDALPQDAFAGRGEPVIARR